MIYIAICKLYYKVICRRNSIQFWAEIAELWYWIRAHCHTHWTCGTDNNINQTAITQWALLSKMQLLGHSGQTQRSGYARKNLIRTLFSLLDIRNVSYDPMTSVISNCAVQWWNVSCTINVFAGEPQITNYMLPAPISGTSLQWINVNVIWNVKFKEYTSTDIWWYLQFIMEDIIELEFSIELLSMIVLTHYMSSLHISDWDTILN